MLRRRGAFVVATIMILGLGAAAYVVLSDDIYPISDPLQPADVEIDDSGRRVEHTVPFHDDGDTTMATATIEVWRVAENLHELRTNIVHEPGTNLESFEFMFALPGSTDSLALRTPGGYPWPPITYHVTDDGRSVLVGASDLGIQGEGSLTLDFLLVDGASVEDSDDIGIGIVFELRDDGLLKLAKHRAEATINVDVPID